MQLFRSRGTSLATVRVMVATVEQRGCASDILHTVVREGMPQFLDDIERSGRSLPFFVLREFERYEGCGDPTNGFAWLQCKPCAYHRLVPFSCQGRAFCPSCGGRRMAERAAHLVDHVFPQVGVRQWVLTVPWGRRFLLARDHALARGVLKLVLKDIFAWVSRAIGRRGPLDVASGAVTVIQRFGSALRLNVHFHILVLDGGYTETESGEVVFHRCPKPTTAEVGDIVERICERVEAYFAKQGHGEDDVFDSDPDDAQELLQMAAVSGVAGVGSRRGQRARRVVWLGGREVKLPPRCATAGGYNLHANTSVGSQDREGLERLTRYISRPALSKSRLKRRPDGSVMLELKRAWFDGTTGFVFTPSELVERLASLVPAPRTNTVVYHGVLAANAGLRSRVVVDARGPSREPSPEEGEIRLSRADRLAKRRVRWTPWSTLLHRVFGVEGWRCPECGERMVLRAVVIHPPATSKVLSGLSGIGRAPPAVGMVAPLG